MPGSILTIDRTVIPFTPGAAPPRPRGFGRGGGAWPPRADPDPAWNPDWRPWGRIDGWPFEFAVSHVAPPPEQRADWTLSPVGVWVGFRPT